MSVAAGLITRRIRKAGNSFVITVPKEEMVRLGLSEGQLVGVQFIPVEVRPILPPDLQPHFEGSWQHNEPGYRYLAER